MKKLFFITIVYSLLISPDSLLSQDILDNMRPMYVGGNWGRTPLWLHDQPEDYYEFLRSLSTNWAGLTVGVHVDNSTDSELERIYDNIPLPTFREEPLRDAIKGFKANNLKTLISFAIVTESAAQSSKPVHRWQIGDPDAPDYDSNIQRENWPWDTNHPDHLQFVDDFWNSYIEQAVYYARICEEENVEMYAIGVETDRLFRSRAGRRFTNHFSDYINALVDSVRKYYSGLITYEQHWSVLNDLDLQPGIDNLFEDSGMDVVGLSAYFQLTPTEPDRVMGVDEFEAAWMNIFTNNIIPLQNRNPGKKIVFLEFGYNDHLGSPFMSVIDEFSPKSFKDDNQNGLDDGEEQQSNIYEAFFKVNEQNGRTVSGAFLWGHDLCSDEDWNSSFGQMITTSVRNKIAEDVVKTYYTEFTPIPDSPNLISPLNGTVDVNLDLTLTWTAATEAVNYDLQVSNQPDFAQDVISIEGIPETFYELSGLQSNTTYYWRVKSKNLRGESDWSEAFSFSTYFLPSIPVLVYPVDGAVDLQTEVQLQWQQSDYSEMYDVIVSDDFSLSPIVFSFVDVLDTNVYLEGLNSSFNYFWHVRGKNVNGMSEWSETFTFTTEPMVGIKNIELPKKYSLSQNYPNPFNPSTIIQYALPLNSNVKLEIYNVLGQRVKVLINQQQTAGLKSVEWNATNFSSGIYLIRMIADPTDESIEKYKTIKKMILIK